MASQLNIKDPETIRLAREMAASRGKSITAVIRLALEKEAKQRADEIAESWQECMRSSQTFVRTCRQS